MRFLCLILTLSLTIPALASKRAHIEEDSQQRQLVQESVDPVVVLNLLERATSMMEAGHRVFVYDGMKGSIGDVNDAMSKYTYETTMSGLTVGYENLVDLRATTEDLLKVINCDNDLRRLKEQGPPLIARLRQILDDPHAQRNLTLSGWAYPAEWVHIRQLIDLSSARKWDHIKILGEQCIMTMQAAKRFRAEVLLGKYTTDRARIDRIADRITKFIDLRISELAGLINLYNAKNEQSPVKHVIMLNGCVVEITLPNLLYANTIAPILQSLNGTYRALEEHLKSWSANQKARLQHHEQRGAGLFVWAIEWIPLRVSAYKDAAARLKGGYKNLTYLHSYVTNWEYSFDHIACPEFKTFQTTYPAFEELIKALENLGQENPKQLNRDQPRLLATAWLNMILREE